LKTREFKERLLVALLLEARKGQLSSFLDAHVVADAYNLQRLPGQLRAVVHSLHDTGLVDAYFTMGGGDEGGLNLSLKSDGMEAAEDLLEKQPEYERPFSNTEIPAADRYVTRADNASIVDAAKDLEVLREAVRATNDVSDDDRDIALSEIAIFEETLAQPRIPTELIERFANYVLKWITSRFANAAVEVVAAALILKLLPLVGST
jgi:hypothetical protein